MFTAFEKRRLFSEVLCHITLYKCANYLQNLTKIKLYKNVFTNDLVFGKGARRPFRFWTLWHRNIWAGYFLWISIQCVRCVESSTWDEHFLFGFFFFFFFFWVFFLRLWLGGKCILVTRKGTNKLLVALTETERASRGWWYRQRSATQE